MGFTYTFADNQKFVRVFGVRRSGNHAIHGFLAQNVGGGSLLLNQCHLGGNPFDTCAAIEHDGTIYHATDVDDFGDEAVITTRAAMRNLLAAATPNVRAVFGFFEEKLRAFPNENKQLRQQFMRGVSSDRAINIVVHRSLSNWLCSAFRHQENYARKQQASALLRAASLLQTARSWQMHGEIATNPSLSDLVIPVFYDKWLKDEQYRANLLDLVGLPHRNLGLPKVSPFGKGSSFFPRNFDVPQVVDGAADRLKLVEDNEFFQKIAGVLFEDEEFRNFAITHHPGCWERLLRMQSPVTSQAV